jgi:predicted RNase H-like HicB family nuclease
MAQRADRYLKVSVIFEKREDGGLRAYSDDVPGLVLSGADPEAVYNDVIPALETLFEHNRGKRLKFAPAANARTILEEDGFLPPAEPKEVRDYVAPWEKEAA